MLSAIVKKKKSKLPTSPNSGNSVTEVTNLSETGILKETVDLADLEADGQSVADLKTQLQLSQSELEAAKNEIKQDEDTITALLIQLENIQDQLVNTQSRILEMEEGSEGDNSFYEAEVFKLKKLNEELQQELEKKSDLDKQVNHLTEELVDLQMQNQELRFQEERSSTRSKMKSITEEKNMGEEIQRLQKELRTTERNMKLKTSSFEAQLKAFQDGKDRFQEKAKVAQARFNELDKERLELKIANNRLQNKLEKSSIYAEKKRLQTEQETVELELNNLKRKNVKLEKQCITASNQMLNMIGHVGNDYNGENGANQSMTDSHIPRQSLSESKMINLEKEVTKLEETVAKLSRENKNLKENARFSEPAADVFLLKIKEQDDQLKTERSKVEEMKIELGSLKKIAACNSGEGHLSDIQKQMEKLEQGSKDIEMRFRVKEKDLWSTIEAQKKQIEELEMKILALELGENEDQGSDTEESERPGGGSSERISELQKDIQSLQISKNRLEEYLQETLKQLQETEESRLSEHQQKWTVDDARQEELEKLKKTNEHLRGALEERITENRNLQSDFVSFQEEFKSLKKHNEEITFDLEKAISTSMQVPFLQSEIERLKQEVIELDNKIHTAESDMVSSDAIRLLENEVERLNILNFQLMKDFEAVEEHFEEEMEETEKLQIGIKKLEKENKMLQTDLKSTEDELDKLEAELIEQIRVQEKEVKNLKDENAKVSI